MLQHKDFRVQGRGTLSMCMPNEALRTCHEVLDVTPQIFSTSSSCSSGACGVVIVFAANLATNRSLELSGHLLSYVTCSLSAACQAA